MRKWWTSGWGEKLTGFMLFQHTPIVYGFEYNGKKIILLACFINFGTIIVAA